MNIILFRILTLKIDASFFCFLDQSVPRTTLGMMCAAATPVIMMLSCGGKGGAATIQTENKCDSLEFFYCQEHIHVHIHSPT